MITIKDWVGLIPDEERHLAYVGEHETVTRQFLLTEPGFEAYTFYMDMAFDLSTVTTCEQSKQETVQNNSREEKSDTLSVVTATSQKESRTLTDVQVDWDNPTDIAPLDKQVTAEGLCLTWTVLGQHTRLPGRLEAVIRGVGPEGQVKKTAIMQFIVGSSVAATPGAPVEWSEFEQMEAQFSLRAEAMRAEMEALAQTTATNAAAAQEDATTANTSAISAEEDAAIALENARATEEFMRELSETVETAPALQALRTIIEQNKHVHFSVWLGTRAEYEALTEKKNNCLYIMEDDLSYAQLIAAMEEYTEAYSRVAPKVIFSGNLAKDANVLLDEDIRKYRYFHIGMAAEDGQIYIMAHWTERGKSVIRGNYIYPWYGQMDLSNAEMRFASIFVESETGEDGYVRSRIENTECIYRDPNKDWNDLPIVEIVGYM